MRKADIANVFIKKCLNRKFRHFDQQNKCAINHYSYKYDSITLSRCFTILLLLIIVKTIFYLP